MSLLDNFCIENQTRIYTDTKARFSFGERSRARLVEAARRGFIGPQRGPSFSFVLRCSRRTGHGDARF